MTKALIAILALWSDLAFAQQVQFVGFSTEEAVGHAGIKWLNILCRQDFGDQSRICISGEIITTLDLGPPDGGSLAGWVQPTRDMDLDGPTCSGWSHDDPDLVGPFATGIQRTSTLRPAVGLINLEHQVPVHVGEREKVRRQGIRPDFEDPRIAEHPETHNIFGINVTHRDDDNRMRIGIYSRHRARKQVKCVVQLLEIAFEQGEHATSGHCPQGADHEQIANRELHKL